MMQYILLLLSHSHIHTFIITIFKIKKQILMLRILPGEDPDHVYFFPLYMILLN